MSIRRCFVFCLSFVATSAILLAVASSVGAVEESGSDFIYCDSANFSCSAEPGVGECVNGTCYCNETTLGDCFSLAPNNTCQLNSCYTYLEGEGTCRNGTKSRRVAILLSVFLINFGAANFYIERYELAIPQIILGLMLCFFQFGSCAVAAARDDDTSIPCIICCSINSLISLLFLAWWIADLVIFVTNSRNSRDGCPLF